VCEVTEGVEVGLLYDGESCSRIGAPLFRQPIRAAELVQMYLSQHNSSAYANSPAVIPVYDRMSSDDLWSRS